MFSPFTNFQLSRVHLLRYGVCAGIGSGRCRVHGYPDVTAPMTERCTCKRVKVMVMVVVGPRFLMFLSKRAVQVK